MPIGVFANAAAILVGGLLGGAFGKWIPEKIAKLLPNIFGLCAMTIGISLIVQVNTLAVVIIAMILGASMGELLCLEEGVTRLTERFVNRGGDNGEAMDEFISVLVLFVFSGTGIFGALFAGVSGDHSIVFAKAILDLFTALIFGASVGYVVGATAVPHAVFLCALFYMANLIIPLVSDAMIGDFKACGGLMTLAVGLKMCRIKHFKVMNLVPAIIIVMPISYLWSLLPI